MKTDFEKMMADATRLMRSGQLGEATAAIQAALGVKRPAGDMAGGTPAWGYEPSGDHGVNRHERGRDGGDVIDVQARVIAEPDDGGASGASGAIDAPDVARTSDADRKSGVVHDSGGGARAGAAFADPGPSSGAAAESFTGATFRNALGSRDYKLFEPARDGRPLPLIVMLHGCTQDPDDFARGTGMNELARERGFVVLYPAQTQAANTSRCWNWFKHNHQARDRGEPGILAGMVRAVMSSHHIDADRVYVAGLSAGGAMAAILGDAYPDLFAAVGVHSGLPTGSATDVQGAFAAMNGGANPVRRSPRFGATPPTIVFHGDADTTVHIVNGERVLAAAGLEARPAEVRGRSVNGRDFTRRVFVDAWGGERAEQWTVHGAGHAWSGGQTGGSYTDPSGPDASAEMVRFFLAHPLR